VLFCIHKAIIDSQMPTTLPYLRFASGICKERLKELEQRRHSDGNASIDRQQAWGETPATSFSY